MARLGRSFPIRAHTTPFDLTSTIIPFSGAHTFSIRLPPVAIPQNVYPSFVVTPVPVWMLVPTYVQGESQPLQIVVSTVYEAPRVIGIGSIAQAPPTTTAETNIPQPTTSSQVILGQFPGLSVTLTVVDGAQIQANNLPQPTVSSQVIRGQSPGLASTVPTPDQIQASNLPQPLSGAQVHVGLTPGNAPPIVLRRDFVTQNDPTPQNVYGSTVVGGIVIGNPPPAATILPGLVTSSSPAQNVYGDSVQSGLNPQLSQTVSLSVVVQSEAPASPVGPSQIIGGIRPFVPTQVAYTVQSTAQGQPVQPAKVYLGLLVSTVPKIPITKGQAIPQPVTSVRVLGGITIGTPPPLVTKPPGKRGLTDPSEKAGATTPTSRRGNTQPTQKAGT